MTISAKTFTELTIQQLYDILQLRAAVFVVEQNCVYQDIDGKDPVATHILGYEANTLVAYTRYFNPGDYFDQASIGRVVVHTDYRKNDYGKKMMHASIAFAKANNHTIIKISAQCYLDKFYSDLGFKSTGATYLEDGIPHQAMVLEIL